ncbi:MAG: ATP-binding protein [Alphaproteobacteria bacterium]
MSPSRPNAGAINARRLRRWMLVVLGVLLTGAVAAGALYMLINAGVVGTSLLLAAIVLALVPVGFGLALGYGLRPGRAEPEAPSVPAPGRLSPDSILAAFDSADGPHALIGPSGDTLHANAAFVDIFRGKGTTAAGAVEVALGNTGLQAFVRVVRAATGGTARFEDVVAEVDGQRRRRRIEATPVDQSPGHVFLRIRDIPLDDRGDAAPADPLLATDIEIDRLFEDAPFGIATLSPQGQLHHANRTFVRMFGLAAAAPGSAPIADLLNPESRDVLQQRIEHLMNSNGGAELPLEVRPARRQEAIISVFLGRVPDRAGRGAGVVLQCLDVTQQRNLENQFAQSQKMQAVGQLAGGIAHDFNNLLTAMIGFCDLLLLRHRPGEQSFADIMQIKQNANRAADLVRQLLAFSRQQTLKPRVLRVTNVLADLSHLLRRLVGSAIELNMVHGRDLGPVRVDKGQLEQVIINLVVNARDAMTDGGEVKIVTKNFTTTTPIRLGSETVPPGEYVQVDVIDRGVGIPRENIGRIFEPFFSTKEVGSGTGLGLSTVYGIVKQTGGHIVVDSTPGQGSRFTIYLPVHKEDAQSEASEPVARDASIQRDLTGAGSILLVEDEDAVRLFSSRALRNKGYTVYEAKSGHAALETLSAARQKIDLLVTDIVMPQMDGTTLIREVRERWPHMKIVCISGYAEETYRHKIDRADDVHFLSKPFSLNQLASMVKDVIGQR